MGLINSAAPVAAPVAPAAPPVAPPVAAVAPVASAPDETAPTTMAQMQPDALMAKMHLPPNMQKPFQAVIVAGMKVLFSPSTNSQVMKQIEQPGAMGSKLGQGIAGLMAMLFDQSQRSIPPQLMIPAGIILMSQAAVFLNKSSIPVSVQDFGAAMQIMIETLLKAFKVDPAAVQAKVSTMQGAQ